MGEVVVVNQHQFCLFCEIGLTCRDECQSSCGLAKYVADTGRGDFRRNDMLDGVLAGWFLCLLDGVI